MRRYAMSTPARANTCTEGSNPSLSASSCNPNHLGPIEGLFTLYQNQQQQQQPKACVEAHDSSGQGTGTTCN
jgi:hypothetical protein